MLASRVEQQEVAVAQSLIVGTVVHDAAVGPATHDRMIGEVRVVRAELVHDLCHHLVLHTARTHETHGAAVGAHGDLRGAAELPLLGAALVETHVVEHVTERHELLRDAHPLARVGAHAVDPAHHARIELEVHPHGVEDARTLLHQAGKNLVDVRDRKGIVRAITLDRAVGTCPGAVPCLAQRIVFAHEQEILGMRATWREYRHGIGLGKAAQVIELAVLAIRVLDVTVAVAHRRGGQHGDGVLTDHAHELPAAAREFLTIHAAARYTTCETFWPHASQCSRCGTVG